MSSTTGRMLNDSEVNQVSALFPSITTKKEPDSLSFLTLITKLRVVTQYWCSTFCKIPLPRGKGLNRNDAIPLIVVSPK